ncbi:GNAT family N-acetyltransferase [Amnibacterium soli]|uniref:GNAT family N-acetyltransferase n=1 Tax=Amnibacterium soli TaxID=1282736 RepID=A0ABP8ZBC2_9MICO
MEPVETTAGGRALRIRRATAQDVPAIVALLTDDAIGAGRERADDLEPYRRAFAAVDADPAHLIVVAEVDGEVAATLQLSLLPGLSRQGALRAQVEGVRVGGAHRGSGLGTALLRWALGESRDRGAALVQLTTDLRREDARRFYERLGFAGSHLGMKLDLGAGPAGA